MNADGIRTDLTKLLRRGVLFLSVDQKSDSFDPRRGRLGHAVKAWRRPLGYRRRTKSKVAARPSQGHRRFRCGGGIWRKVRMPASLVFDKTGVEPDCEHTKASLELFDRGHSLEPIVPDRFRRETGLTVRRMPFRVSKDRLWMRVNVDRIRMARR